MNLSQIAGLTEDESRAYIERLRWPDGPACIFCGDTTVTKLAAKSARKGLYQCKGCRKQFRVEVGTILEGSRVPLKKWLMAFALLCEAKKGVSACQLQRHLALGSYQTAWHMAHRIRHAMRSEPLKRLLGGDVEADELYYGPKPKEWAKRGRGPRKPVLREKTPVLTLVERGGELRAMTLERVTAANLGAALAANVDRSARLLTDESKLYRTAGRKQTGGHEKCRHATFQFAKPGGVHVNTAESFHGLFRRGIAGSFHHVSRFHLHRYVDEFAWRWNHRAQKPGDAVEDMIRLTEGRRLTYCAVKSSNSQKE